MSLFESLQEKYLTKKLDRVKKKRVFTEKISIITNQIETEQAIIDNLSAKPKKESKFKNFLVKFSKGVEKIEAPNIPKKK